MLWPLMETKRMPELHLESQPGVLERTPLPAVMKCPPAHVLPMSQPRVQGRNLREVTAHEPAVRLYLLRLA